VTSGARVTAAPTIYDPVDAGASPGDLGGKVLGLLAITEAGLTTPPWFAVRPGAIRPGQPAPAEVRAAVEEAYARLVAGGAATVAVRSSALDEDGAERSFAGQYVTTLDVRGPDAVLAAIARSVEWAEQGETGSYRRAHGDGSVGSSPIAVIVQGHVDARAAGVAFSRDPLAGTAEVVIAAAREAEAVTSGAASADEYRVAADGTIRVVRLAGGRRTPGAVVGSAEAPAPPEATRVLDDVEARAVARAARLLEERRAAPQDIEWAFTGAGDLVILQARRITALPAAAPAGDVRVWDNANIVESFPELTLPLTFSIAVELYASVYRGACLALGVPRRTVDREAEVFEQMLGLLQGRVYYNLTSWYRVLALLPGFRLTAGYLEAMMGARRPGAAPEERARPVLASPARWWEIAAMTVRMAWRLAWFGRDAARFRSTIRGLLDHRRDTQEASASFKWLVADFDRLRADAVRDWRAPIMNDLFLMLTHGALRRVAARWIGADAHALVNGLIAGGSVASAAPGRELLAIASSIREQPEWLAVVTETPAEMLPARMAQDPELAGLNALVDGYVQAWGDRAPRELQLDRPSYRENPAPLLRALRSLVVSEPAAHMARTDEAAAEVRRRLQGRRFGGIRVIVVSLLTRAARRHIRWREEMRLLRGQVFGVGRRIFREAGDALVAEGLIDRADDIHYLTIGELHGIARGTNAIGDPRTLVRLRRTEYDDHALRPRLPSRLETRGLALDPLDLEAARAAQGGGPVAGGWRGIGAAHGRVHAPALVVVDPAQVTPIPGHIVVARTTDPGWVPILVGAAGLLVEQGSLLSHSAIVARELGIPTVVGLPGLLDTVRTGDLLELDGATGEVRRLPPAEGAA
jgi:rifampicin phosphotransferase